MQLYRKELKKVCFSFVYILFLALLIWGWYKNFYGVTEQQISMVTKRTNSVYEKISGGSILEKPDKNAEHYGNMRKEDPENIMRGGTDILIIEYNNNSYATYPFGYYKEVSLSDTEQKEILNIICEITGLTEEQIENLPDDYFPSVNGNIIRPNSDVTFDENGSMIASMGTGENNLEDTNDHTKRFVSQVSYERFKQLMLKIESIVGPGSSYSMKMLLEYYGQTEMSYADAMNEYNRTIYEDKISTAFARLFCDYLSRTLGLYPAFIVAMFWLKDRRNHMNELIDSKNIKSVKMIFVRYLAILAAVMIPVVLLSFESLIPLMQYSAETGIVIDNFAFIKYIVWWLLPMAMIIISLGTLLTILTNTPIAILIQFAWWIIDSGMTGLCGDTELFTLMIRHNTLNGSELIQQGLSVIWLNRSIYAVLSIILLGCSCAIYNAKRRGSLNYEFTIQKYCRIFKKRIQTLYQK